MWFEEGLSWLMKQRTSDRNGAQCKRKSDVIRRILVALLETTPSIDDGKRRVSML
jgi:hypothetical protein